MLKLFNKNKSTSLYAPTHCEVIPMEDVPDQVFASKMIGDGIAFLPYDNMIKSPGDGLVMQIFPTKHAIALDINGFEILLHLGIDTVELKGNGFQPLVKEGQRVKHGDNLINMDLDYIKSQQKSTICPMIITNMDKVKRLEGHQIREKTFSGVILEIWGS